VANELDFASLAEWRWIMGFNIVKGLLAAGRVDFPTFLSIINFNVPLCTSRSITTFYVHLCTAN